MQAEDINPKIVATWSVDDLKPGDIIFTDPGGAGAEFTHAAIYAPEKGNPLCLIHAVFAKDSNLTKLMRTSLPPSNYRVFRSNDPEANLLSAHIAKQWARYQVPYDEQRLQAGSRKDSSRKKVGNVEEDRNASLHAAQHEFNQSGRFRCIKYAARRMTSSNLPPPYGRGRGVRCGMFALMCHQTARLAKADLVEPLCGSQSTPWVSDKYTNTKALPEKYSEKPTSFNPKILIEHAQRKKNWPAQLRKYDAYQQKLMSPEEFRGYKHHADHKQVTKEHAVYSPSIIAWDYQKNGEIDKYPFENVLTKGLMLEQKTIDPDTFAFSLQKDAGNWQEAKLNVPELGRKYTESESKCYKAAIQKDIGTAEEHRAELISYLSKQIEKIPTYDEGMRAEKEIKSSFGH
jgi:hypothetical protein